LTWVETYRYRGCSISVLSPILSSLAALDFQPPLSCSPNRSHLLWLHLFKPQIYQQRLRAGQALLAAFALRLSYFSGQTLVDELEIVTKSQHVLHSELTRAESFLFIFFAAIQVPLPKGARHALSTFGGEGENAGEHSLALPLHDVRPPKGLKIGLREYRYGPLGQSSRTLVPMRRASTSSGRINAMYASIGKPESTWLVV